MVHIGDRIIVACVRPRLPIGRSVARIVRTVELQGDHKRAAGGKAVDGCEGLRHHPAIVHAFGVDDRGVRALERKHVVQRVIDEKSLEIVPSIALGRDQRRLIASGVGIVPQQREGVLVHRRARREKPSQHGRQRDLGRRGIGHGLFHLHPIGRPRRTQRRQPRRGLPLVPIEAGAAGRDAFADDHDEVGRARIHGRAAVNRRRGRAARLQQTPMHPADERVDG